MGGLEDLMMGQVSEEAKESDEQIQARIAAAQAKLAKIRKDESKAKNFDDILAKLIPNLAGNHLEMVIFFINHEVPSLTILAILSIGNDEAGKVCFVEFQEQIKHKADFSSAKLPAKADEKVSYWWTFIYAADHVTTVTRLKDLRENVDFVKKCSHYLGVLLHEFLINNKIENFNQNALKKILKQYETQIFAE